MTSRRRALTDLTSSGMVLIAAMCVAAFAGTSFLGAGDGHTLTARFSTADGLVAGNVVRIGGVEAGAVQSVAVGASGAGRYAVVTLSVDAAHWPLHQGATAAVRPISVLGEMYVDLSPGSPSAPPLEDGVTLGLSQTRSPVNIDELQNVFQPDARAAIRTQLQQGVVALGGAGPAHLNATLVNANPLTASLDPLTAVLAARSPELDRLNSELDTITGDLARENAALGGAIQGADTTLAALAARETALQGTLVHAAGTLQSLGQGLAGEQGNLATVFREAPAALRDAQSAAGALTPLITAVNPHIADLDILLQELLTATGYPAHQGANPTAPPLDTMRIDASLASGPAATACGGEPAQLSCGGGR